MCLALTSIKKTLRLQLFLFHSDQFLRRAVCEIFGLKSLLQCLSSARTRHMIPFGMVKIMGSLQGVLLVCLFINLVLLNKGLCWGKDFAKDLGNRATLWPG